MLASSAGTLRAFEIDSIGTAKIDFRKSVVDRCQQPHRVGHPTEGWQAVKDFRVNPVSPPERPGGAGPLHTDGLAWRWHILQEVDGRHRIESDGA